MFEYADALSILIELKMIFGRAIFGGIIFLAAYRYAMKILEDIR